jgi:dolichol-phosphate mannosyltransferase
MKIAAVIPAFRVKLQICRLLKEMPAIIDMIIVVDDKCPELSGKEAEKVSDKRITVIYHDQNTGVGGAVITGYRKALEWGCDIVIKIDGDGQMDPVHIPSLIAPLIKDEADYTKGNRFMDFNSLGKMPGVRLFGNSILSFLLKIVSGYWNIIDPTNGYTAIRKNILEKLNLDKLSKRYFFECDMLIRLNILNAVVRDISMPAEYNGENSSLSITKVLFQFPPKLLSGLIRRIFFKYYIYDFNMASIYILIGLPMFMFGITFGALEWFESMLYSTPRTAGTIMLSALPIIVSFQMLLQAISIDINSVPKKNG